MLKKSILLCILLLIAVYSFGQTSNDPFPAKPNTLVTDYTNTLNDSQKQQLENKLVAFDDSTSTQVTVVIIRSVGAWDINDYAAKLGRAWGVGQKGKNNGVVLLVALNDHKVSIQTGYGEEGALPDAITQQIIQTDMLPRFKQNDYYDGLNAATDDIIKYTKGEYKQDKRAINNNGPDQQQSSGGSGWIIVIIVVVVLILIFRHRGGGGGGGRIIGSRGGASPFWWFMAGNMLGGGGRSWGGGGGSSGGGGGGFGGFGGGSFGGGGSSGSW